MKTVVLAVTLSMSFFTSAFYAQHSISPSVLFVLDCSGSMWQKIQNETKISVAKKVLGNLADKLPKECRIGLIAYGHKSKSDCDDIETVIPLGAFKKESFMNKINLLDPKGKTPISKSLTHALNEIKNEPSNTNIVLISDGLETCEGNACELIANAIKSGVKITLHVIGFGIEDSNRSDLECLVQAGGGQYFPVNKPDELLNALEKSIEAPIKNGGYLSIKTYHQKNLLDAIIKVYKPGESNELLFARTYTDPSTNPRILKLTPGNYRVEVMAVRLDGKPTQYIENAEVRSDTSFHTVDFTTGTVEILVTNNGNLSDASIQIIHSNTNKVMASGRSYTSSNSNPRIFEVLPGSYRIEISSVDITGRPAIFFENQKVHPEKTLKLHHKFETAELLLGAKQGDQLIDAVIDIRKNGKSIGSGRTYQNPKSNPKSFTLEAGAYKIELKPVKPKGLQSKSFEIFLNPNQRIDKILQW
jgi:Ca-activated chloride channel homolog